VSDPAQLQDSVGEGTRPVPRLSGADPVLFDLDGTLTASGPGILASVRHALDRMGKPQPVPDVLDSFIGPPLHESFQVLCGMDPELAWTAVLAYRERYAEHGQYESSVYPGIVEVLDDLAGAGRVLAVATSKSEVFARSVLDHFGLTRHFVEIVGAQLDGTRTHKAEVVAEALLRLGRPAGDAVLIGDRAQDVVGARAVGLPCVGALWGYGSAEELAGAGAAALAETPHDLLALLLP
jgi:phosphoglycolate phosphatase